MSMAWSPTMAASECTPRALRMGGKRSRMFKTTSTRKGAALARSSVARARLS
jgi:hypothetical protein